MIELEQFRDYMSIERNKSHNTVSSYLTDLNQFFAFVGKPCREVTTADIDMFIQFIRSSGNTVSTSNRKLSAVKTFYKFLVRKGMMSFNPAAAVEGGDIGQRLPKPIDQEDIEKIIDATASLRDRVIFEVLYSTGLRRSELTSIKVDDINFRQGYLNVIGKGNKERVIPLIPSTLELIEKLVNMQSSMWLFPSSRCKDHPISIRQVNDIVTKYTKKAGVRQHVTPHSFRHSFGTHLYHAGSSLDTIQELLGHASIDTTRGYAKVDNRKNREALLAFHPRARSGVCVQGNSNI